jgi:hypothetical protein
MECSERAAEDDRLDKYEIEHHKCKKENGRLGYKEALLQEGQIYRDEHYDLHAKGNRNAFVGHSSFPRSSRIPR